MSRSLVLVLVSSSLRRVTEQEALSSLAAETRQVARRVVDIDLRPFESDVEGGGWSASEAEIRRHAREVRAVAEELNDPEVHFFGIAEIPHLVALGAYIGDEHHVVVHDLDRDTVDRSWGWPTDEPTLELDVSRLPAECVSQPGAVVTRVAISAAITDEDVEEYLESGVLADIEITLAGGRVPQRGVVQSLADVAAIRAAFRSVLASIEQNRPNAEVLHLFLAAPPSVCFIIGQELHLRSGLPVRSYRFRTREEPFYRPAILLRSESDAADVPLTEEEVALAAQLRRVVWREALKQVADFARELREEKGSESEAPRWYQTFDGQDDFRAIDPHPHVPPLWKLVHSSDAIADEPRPVDYAFDKTEPSTRRWRVSDRLILGFHAAAGGDPERLIQLIRLFFFHEYLHDYHALTKYTAEQVGRFANCLERIDYVADSYSLLHQLELLRRLVPDRFSDDDHERSVLVGQVELALRSFWAFDGPPPQAEMQERRVRRYLNWYWRRVQLREASPRSVRLRLLSEAPSIELAGLRYRTEAGRVFVQLDAPARGPQLEIGVVLEDGRFDRRGSAGDLSLEALVRAFVELDHEQVDRFFNSLFETLRGTGGHLPRS